MEEQQEILQWDQHEEALRLIGTEEYDKTGETVKSLDLQKKLIEECQKAIRQYEEIARQFNKDIETTLNDSINIRFNVMDITNMIDNIFYNQQIISDGLLGIDFFYDNNVVIDFQNKKILILEKYLFRYYKNYN